MTITAASAAGNIDGAAIANAIATKQSSMTDTLWPKLSINRPPSGTETIKIQVATLVTKPAVIEEAPSASMSTGMKLMTKI